MPITLDPPAIADFSTALNTPNATDGTYSLKMAPAADSSLLRGYLKSLPGGDFTLTIKVQGSFGVNFNGIGMMFRDSAGKYVFYGLKCITGRLLNVENWSTHTTFSAETSFSLGAVEFPSFLRAQFTSATSDIAFSWSYTGDNWVSQGAANTYLATCDAYGIGCSVNNASIAPIGFWEHFETV